MPSMWDHIDVLGSIQKGRQMGAQRASQNALRSGDYDTAARELLPFDPQAAQSLIQIGEQERARREKRETEEFDREVAPLIASGDVASAQRLAVTRRRPASQVVQLMELGRTMDNQKLTRARENAGRTALQIRGFEGLSEDQRSLAYDALRARLIEEDPSTAQHLPEQYDPTVVRNLMYASVDAKEALDQIAAERKAELEERRVAVQEAGLGLNERRVAATEMTAQAALARAAGGDAREAERDQQRIRSGETSLRKEFEDRQKEFVAVRDSFAQIRGLQPRAGIDAGADLALVFSYMKMLDPGSVVREQEFANAQNAAGVPDRVRNLYNNALRGTRLNPAQIQDFVRQANSIYTTRLAQMRRDAEQYRDYARGYGYAPENVVRDLALPEETAPPPPPPPPGGRVIRLDANGRRQP